MGKRSDFKRVERDFYPTPLEAVKPLIPHLPYGSIFTEPCAGAFDLVQHLEDNSMSCNQCFDIHPMHHDVYEQDALGDWYADNSSDYIITNPPWDTKILHPMIEQFSRMKPTWLLFYADWMHTKQSAPYMKYCHKIVSVGRVKWIPDSKMTGKDNCAWYLFDQTKLCGDTVFIGRLKKPDLEQ